jgi:MoaA/NifB/PqqE/SkfB family radical SAM enzyme
MGLLSLPLLLKKCLELKVHFWGANELLYKAHPLNKNVLKPEMFEMALQESMNVVKGTRLEKIVNSYVNFLRRKYVKTDIDKAFLEKQEAMYKSKKGYYMARMKGFINDPDDADFVPKDVVCTAPWDHIYLRPDQRFGLCCIATSFNSSAKSSSEYWNSYEMKQIRIQMMNGNYPKDVCRRCFHEKTMAIPGYVRRKERSIDDIPVILESTKSDGTTTFSPTTLEIRTNYCNFKCRMCSENYSSSIRAEKVKLGEKLTSINEIENLDLSDDQLRVVKFINWAGGEPFMSPVHWDIMNRLVKIGKTKVSINYDTNLSFPGKTLDKAKDLLSKFQNIRFSASLDGIGEDVEYIREGIVYDEFLHNLAEMKKIIKNDPSLYDQSISILKKNGMVISYTATSLGILTLPNVIQLCLEHDIGFQGRLVYIDEFNFLNLNVVKREVLEEIFAHCNRIAKDTYLEREISEYCKFLLNSHSPVVMSHRQKDYLEEVRGKKGYFDSRMNGLLNE